MDDFVTFYNNDNYVTLERYFRAYIYALEEGGCKNNVVRIMMIGPEFVGKTTLLKILTKQSLPRDEPPTQVADGNYPYIELISFDVGEMAATGLGVITNNNIGEVVLHTDSAGIVMGMLSNMRSRDIFNPLVEQRVDRMVQNLDEEKLKPRKRSEPAEQSELEEASNNAVKKPKMSNEQQKLYAVFWDFGDQAEYHVTHQPFMSCNSIYVLVFNIVEQLDDAIQRRNNLKSDMTYVGRMQEWLASVHGCRQHDSQSVSNREITIDGTNYELPIVIMIGSHADQIQANDEEEKNRKIDEAYKNISNQFSGKSFSKHIYLSHLVMNGNPSDETEATQQQRYHTCKQLCQIFVKIAQKLPFMNDAIPVRWYEIVEVFRGKRDDMIKPILTKAQVKELIDKHQLSKEGENLDHVLWYLHSIGLIVYCDKDEKLSSMIVCNIDWLIAVFCSLIRISEVKSSHTDINHQYDQIQKTGRIDDRYIRHAWNKFNLNEDERNYVLALMTHYDILCPTSEVVRRNSNNRIYLIPCILDVKPKMNDLYQEDCVKSQNIYIEFHKDELPYISYNIFYCLIVECLKNSEWNNRAVKLYQSCAVFRINPGIHLIIDKLSSAIGLQLVYYPPSLRWESGTEMLIKNAKEIDPKSLIECYLRRIIGKWMPYLKDIEMVVSVKCPRCGELLDVEIGLSLDKSFLHCDNCSQTWLSSYHLQYWLIDIQGIVLYMSIIQRYLCLSIQYYDVAIFGTTLLMFFKIN